MNMFGNGVRNPTISPGGCQVYEVPWHAKPIAPTGECFALQEDQYVGGGGDVVPMVERVRREFPKPSWYTRYVSHGLMGEFSRGELTRMRLFRFAALNPVRGLLTDELIRIFGEDHPHIPYDEKSETDEMDELRMLPDETVRYLLANVVRIHPSPLVRERAQEIIFAGSIHKNSEGIRAEELPPVRDNDPSTEMLETAALLNGKWTFYLLKMLIEREDWNSVAKVVSNSDYPQPDALAYALWIGHKRGKAIPLRVARNALDQIPLYRFVWRGRMRKMIKSLADRQLRLGWG